jgi:V/A-type H+-transporting ATPase subunit C
MMFGLTLPRLESRALKYGYSNARVKAMKGLLLKPNFLDELIRVKSIEAVIELLQRTPYKGDFAIASVSYTGSELIELAAAKNLARTVCKLIKITPKSDKEVLRALLLKYDLLNLKTIMHAKKLGKSFDEVKPYLVEAGGLSEEDFRRLMKADEKNIIREVRRTPLGEQMLSQSTAQFSKGMWNRFHAALKSLDAFMQMETIVDAYSFLLMDKALSDSGSKDIEYIREILKREIDARNILIIERLKKHGKKNFNEHLIKGGTLSDSLIKKIIEAKDLSQTVKLAKGKFSRLEFEGSELSDLEIAFEKSIAAQKSVAFHRGMLSVGVIIGFMLLKEEEVSNLRKIAKGKEFGIPEKDVRDMLVVV